MGVAWSHTSGVGEILQSAFFCLDIYSKDERGSFDSPPYVASPYAAFLLFLIVLMIMTPLHNCIFDLFIIVLKTQLYNREPTWWLIIQVPTQIDVHNTDQSHLDTEHKCHKLYKINVVWPLHDQRHQIQFPDVRYWQAKDMLINFYVFLQTCWLLWD